MGLGAVVATAWAYSRLREDVAGAQLLRAELMPTAAAILGAHLAGQRRVLPTAEFIEAAGADLDALRDTGLPLARSIQEYLTEWVRAGYLIRRVGAGREETLELSASTMAAIRFLDELAEPRSAVTSSRLSNVSALLNRLAHDTDPDAASRLAALQSQRDAIDAEMARVAAGHFEPVRDSAAHELFGEILALAVQIPGDFATVSARLEELNRNLREQIINRTGTRGDVLDAVFAGVDVLEDSEAGRSFNSFHALVLDPEQSGVFDEAVDQVLSRGFADDLPTEQVRFLRRLLSTLQAESMAVRDTMTAFSRSLRRFVESRAYLEHRRLAEELAQAQALCLQAVAAHKPITDLGLALASSSMPLGPLSRWVLHNPADLRTAEAVVAQDNRPLDLEVLRRQVRESEIDFVELRHNVAETLGRRGAASLAEVLADHPATQGLASVVGLLVLAADHAALGAGEDELGWTSARGLARTVRTRRYVFDHVPPHWSPR